MTRQTAEESLRQSEERFRLILESIHDYAIFMLDPEGFVLTWNPGAERTKGYRAEEIIGQHFSRFYSPEEVAAGKCDLQLRVAAREGRVEDEGWRFRKDGSRFWANVVINALRGERGEVVGYTKVTRDLTERRALEENRFQLGQAARKRISLLADLSEALAGTQTVEEVGRAVTEKGMAFAQSDTCTLYLLNEQTRELELVAERGCNPTILEAIRRIGPGDDNPSYAIGAGDAPAAWIETPEQYDTFFPAIARMKAEGRRARAFWCVPLVAERRTIGMAAVGFHVPREFPPEEREFIETFARHCAQALARAHRLEAERAAAALAHRLQASLTTTLRSIGDALIATDASGAISMMNGVAEALTGWSEADARGRPLPEVFRIINEYSREVVPSPADKVLETGAIVGLANHTLLITRDGREVPIEDSGAPIRGDGSTVQGVVLVFRDVTERKREEARRMFLADAASVLAESLDYEATVARVAHLAVPRLADWCAVDLVQEGERTLKRLAMAHVDPGKVELGQELNAKYPPSPDATTGPYQVVRTGRSELYPVIPDELLVASCVDDEHLRIARELGLRSAMVVPLATRSRVLGVMSFVFAESEATYTEQDLRFAEELAQRCANAIENAQVYSSEQKARRTADIANRAKDEFLAIVSHELRTPLNAIMGWSKMLTTREFDERRLQNALKTIERNAIAMAQLIEDLLDMSRVISGKLRIEVQPVDVVRVVEAAVESVRPAALAKAIELSQVIDPNLPTLLGDPTRLQQVVWNLLSNAVKFTPRGGSIQTAVRGHESSLEISVQDNGKGINPAFLTNVFQPFRQEDASPSRSRGGLGLGLAITRQLVELHGGQISVHSEGEGLGATFSVTLPVSGASLQTGHPERSARQFKTDALFQKPEHIRGLRVLVVDDEEDSRRLAAMILEECGCDVTTASGVEDALQKFMAAVPDVLLSDIGMPGQDGYDLIRQVRALPREGGGDVPAAALTAYARPEDRRTMLDAGFSIHLPKPVEPSELVATVATLSRFVHRSDRASVY